MTSERESASPDAPSVINWRDEGSKIDTAAHITLDGFVVSGRFLFGEGHASRGGVRRSVYSERPFIFSKVDEGSFSYQSTTCNCSPFC
jgi:hypothetical protein